MDEFAHFVLGIFLVNAGASACIPGILAYVRIPPTGCAQVPDRDINKTTLCSVLKQYRFSNEESCFYCHYSYVRRPWRNYRESRISPS